MSTIIIPRLILINTNTILGLINKNNVIFVIQNYKLNNYKDVFITLMYTHKWIL